MGSKKQWDDLKKFNYYSGKIPPPPRIDELEDTKKNKDKVINCNFSVWQLDIMESALENAIGDSFFTGSDKIIAETLLIDISELK